MRPTNRLRRSASSPGPGHRRRTQPSEPPFQAEPQFFVSSGNDRVLEGACGFSYHTDTTTAAERGSYMEGQHSPDWGNCWIDLGGEG
jgi:hypothetical protein